MGAQQGARQTSLISFFPQTCTEDLLCASALQGAGDRTVKSRDKDLPPGGAGVLENSYEMRDLINKGIM